jgi:hypothetical protein
MEKLKQLLSGGDLRSIGKSNKVLATINTQQDFDNLFLLLFGEERLVQMRAADAVEKITIAHPEYLSSHKKEVLGLLISSKNIEFQWHLALLVSRINLTDKEIKIVWNRLSEWALDSGQSKIVRVNSIQSLFDISARASSYKKQFMNLAGELEKQKVPSISVRLRKLIG